MDLFPNGPISLSKEDIFTNNLSHAEEETTEQNGGLSQLLSQQPIEEDENSEWLSVFVEDCFSTSGNYHFAPATEQQMIIKTSTSTHNHVETLKPQPLQNPKNPRKKRKKKANPIMKLKTHKNPSFFDLEHFITQLSPDPDPPLLDQAHWLADSEPIFPIKQECFAKKDPDPCEETLVDVAVELSLSSEHCIEPKIEKKEKKKVLKPRKCTHCQTEKTPLWRQGPSGKGTLCNACGVRWLKSGNLFPEYRPANSPTFVSDLHSNVLRKVLQMREAGKASGGSAS